MVSIVDRESVPNAILISSGMRKVGCVFIGLPPKGLRRGDCTVTYMKNLIAVAGLRTSQGGHKKRSVLTTRTC